MAARALRETQRLLSLHWECRTEKVGAGAVKEAGCSRSAMRAPASRPPMNAQRHGCDRRPLSRRPLHAAVRDLKRLAGPKDGWTPRIPHQTGIGQLALCQMMLAAPDDAGNAEDAPCLRQHRHAAEA